VVLWAMLAIYLLGGCFMDALAFLLISIPIFFPLAMKLGFDPVWFGVIITLVTTMGAITPPVGISAFVVAGMAEGRLATVFKGILWFLPSYVLTIALTEAFPALVTALSSLVK
jgi:C4-dicarboxylate transporter DctM subunit